MELLCGGELLDRLGQQHNFTEAKANALFKQLVSAVTFMHQKKVGLHRILSVIVVLSTDRMTKTSSALCMLQCMPWDQTVYLSKSEFALLAINCKSSSFRK